MPYIDHNGVRIHYEVEGRGPALVLHHGMGRSIAMWRDGGYVEPLKKSFRLIMLDARGHGDSDKPRDPAAYSADLMIRDVLAVLDSIGVASAHFIGFSLGAKVGWQIGARRMARFRSLALMGPEATLVAAEKAGAHPMPPNERARLLSTDYAAVLACLKGASAWPHVAGALDGLFIPCLLVMGDKDPGYAIAQASAKSMCNAAFVALRGVHHRLAEYNAERVLPHLEPFLAAVSMGLRL
ncbi:MAG: alpha/beta hydrolase [Chloroflexi bacterium]|nr:alpha/beta hydrolase [Chloroflexota bacterium]